MAGSKKNKSKKMLSPSNSIHSPPIPDSHAQDELMDDLLAQLDSRDGTVQSESINILNEIQLNKQVEITETGKKQSAKSRFQARQARKAASIAQTHSPDERKDEERLVKEAEDEERDIGRLCHDLLLQVHEINPDGHCLFSAIADQLAILGILSPPQANYTTVRQTASQYMLSHPNDFIPFLPAFEEDMGGDAEGGIMSLEGFDRYCASIRDTAVWGGEPEILALSRAYDVPIHVIQGGRPPVVVHNPRDGPVDEGRIVRISYHRKMYGLGEHYNSLRPQGPLSHFSKRVQTILSSSLG
ncbi:hypothetical protein BDZ94DRAFT_1161340 [Collybia nuda]|uniref:OTU domain-containing protein n=1 Tax=Collybia nuda TaxID=64659 RepID=A0A9P5YA59_9AGAR|nr:hypothetical protein BDZ94DRAFT_1161340 [Collybia nuda]